MNKVKPTSAKYSSPLRESQAQATRERIANAAFVLFEKRGGQEDLTFKAVAREAGVTEMTVYRHFPTRDELMKALYRQINSRIGVPIPDSVEALLGKNLQAHLGYEKVAPLLLASIMSKQGREMRLSLKPQRQRSFLKIAEEVNPALSPKQKKQVAAIVQLLQSSYAWDSMRTNWDMNPKEIAETTRIALESILFTAKEKL